MRLFSKKKNSRTGFILMEVLVATVILAVTASIMINVLANNTKQQAYLEDKTFAVILADSRLNEIYASDKPDIDLSPKEVDMAGVKWRITTKINSESDIRRVEVSVFPVSEDKKKVDENPGALLTLTGFIGGAK